MKITDLDAQFLVPTEKGHRFVATIEEASGVIFQCPKCGKDAERGEEDGRRYVVGAHYVVCWFAGKVPKDITPGPGRWTVSGSSLENLTLSPSVFLNGEGCGWHGWVQNGDAI